MGETGRRGQEERRGAVRSHSRSICIVRSKRSICSSHTGLASGISPSKPLVEAFKCHPPRTLRISGSGKCSVCCLCQPHDWHRVRQVLLQPKTRQHHSTKKAQADDVAGDGRSNAAQTPEEAESLLLP